MSDQRNSEIKNYISSLFAVEDEDLKSIKQKAVEADLPSIAIPESVGKLLYILTKLQKPKRILEIGTLAGYSTTWFAKAAPEAKIVTIELDPLHTEVARKNFENLSLKNIQLIQGRAQETLQTMISQGAMSFDLFFLDADKEGYPIYLEYILKLARSGSLLISDNLIPKEDKINKPLEKEVIATKIYEFNRKLAAHPNIETILTPTIVGDNGRVDALGISLIS